MTNTLERRANPSMYVMMTCIYDTYLCAHGRTYTHFHRMQRAIWMLVPTKTCMHIQSSYILTHNNIIHSINTNTRIHTIWLILWADVKFKVIFQVTNTRIHTIYEYTQIHAYTQYTNTHTYDIQIHACTHTYDMLDSMGLLQTQSHPSGHGEPVVCIHMHMNACV